MNLTELLDKQPEHRKELSELKFLEMLKERARNSHNADADLQRRSRA